MARKVERGYEKVRKRMGKKKKGGGKKRRKRRNNKPTILKKKKINNNPMGQPKNGTKGRKSTEGLDFVRQINNDSHINNGMV